LDALVRDCQNRGGSAIAIPTDVSNEQNCQALIDQTIQHFGRIDMLVNNAGFSVVGEFAEFPDLDLFKRVMEVNFTGLVQCTYYALPYLKDSRGRVVNVSSLGGKFAIPYNTSYIASKHAVTGFSDSLRMELSKSGVSVEVLMWPGPISKWLKVIAPGFLDKVVMDKVFRPIVKRAKQGDQR
jgi:short-subunit dehydrogenase